MNQEKIYQLYYEIRRHYPRHSQVRFVLPFFLMMFVILLLPVVLITSQNTQVYRSRATYYQPSPTPAIYPNKPPTSTPYPSSGYTQCYCTRGNCVVGFTPVGTCGNTYVPPSGNVAGIQTELAQFPGGGSGGGIPPMISLPGGFPPPSTGSPGLPGIIVTPNPWSGGPTSTPAPATKCCR